MMNRAVTSLSVLLASALAFGEEIPTSAQVDLVEEKACLKLGQNNFDFDIPAEVGKGWGISFIPEMTAGVSLDEAVFFFWTGPRGKQTGWYGKPFSPEQSGERLYFAFRDGWSTQQKPEGWEKIAGIRVAICPERDRQPLGTFRLALKDVKWHAEAPREAQEAKVMRTQKALACPPVAGERHFAWVNDLLDRRQFDWEPFVRRAAADGITDLVPLFATDEEAAYRSRVLPTDEQELAKTGDHIELAKQACRKYGVKLHAWKVNWSCFREKSPAVMRYRAEGRMSRMWNGKGLVDSLWLCPCDERNRKLEYEAMLELAGKGVDGIHFDYIRYDSRRTCYCDRCRAIFENRLGRAVSDWPRDCAEKDGALAASWDAFRRAVISKLVERVSREVRCCHPEVAISAAVVTSHDTCALDWPRWCREKWLDFVCPMTYTPSLSQFERWIGFANKVRIETGVPIYPGIGVFANSSRLDALDCTRQLESARKRGFGGVAFFKLYEGTFPVIDLLGRGPLGKPK